MTPDQVLESYDLPNSRDVPTWAETIEALRACILERNEAREALILVQDKLKKAQSILKGIGGPR
jgi:hypothetical protein